MGLAWRIVLGAGAGWALVACSGTVDGVVARDAWVRPTPPVGNTAALYVSLKNSSGTDDQIISASADVCQELELHQTVLTGDVSSMPAVEADAMSISAGETLLMEPNGLHLMCLGLPAPLVEGEELTLTLTLAQAGDIEVIVKVQQR